MPVHQGKPRTREVGPGRRGALTCAVACALALGTALTGCSASPGTVDFSQVPDVPGTLPTVRITEQVTAVVTTTATVTQTLPVTTTATHVATTTLTYTPPPPRYVPLTTNTPSLPPIRADLDRATAGGAARAIIADVDAIDTLFAGTADVAARLGLLDRNLATLLSAGVPPGLDGPSYVSRILSLRVFTSQAGRDAPTNRAIARSRWDVIRPEIATLLAQVTLGLGTTYVLPTPSATTP